jgi:hypothetical protein
MRALAVLLLRLHAPCSLRHRRALELEQLLHAVCEVISAEWLCVTSEPSHFISL